MKKIGFVFIILLLCSMVSADSVTFSKTDYNIGETFQAEIDFSFDLVESLTHNNFNFFDSNGTEYSVPLFFFKLLENKYYLYFYINQGFEIGEYFFVIDNIIYIENENLIQTELNESFNLSFSNQTLKIHPAILISDVFQTGEVFTIDFYNSGIEDLEVLVESSDQEGISISESSFLIFPGDSISYDVYVDNLILDKSEYQFISVSYNNGSYEIPVWFGELESEENQTNVEGDLFFDSPVSEFNMTLFYDEDKQGYIEITNSHDFDIYNINLNLTGNLWDIISLEYVMIDSILAGETKRLDIDVNSGDLEYISTPGVYSGNLVLDSDTYHDEFPFFVEIEYHPTGYLDCRIEGCESGVCSNETGLCTNGSSSSCSIGSCPTGWVCNITSGLCNVDSPEVPKENDGKIAFIIILTIFVLIIYLIFKRIKGRPKSTFPLPRSS